MKSIMGNGIWFGALTAIVMAFPVAGVLALVYRFPVPFAGYISGVSAMGYAMVGVVFYGLLGGFPLLAVLGGLTGAIMSRTGTDKDKLPVKLIVLVCFFIDLAMLFVLAILDKIIGPW
jgi:hypothetical protein